MWGGGGRRHHQFEEKWVTNPECEEVIRSSWEQDSAHGSPMYCLMEKIKAYRMKLVLWSKQKFGGVQGQIKARMDSIGPLSHDNSRGQHREHIKTLKTEINSLLLSDELHWRQRSRVVWLKVGDKNTRYFHQSASQRKKNNSLIGLTNQQNQWCTEKNQITEIASNYFKELFTSSAPNRIGETVAVVEKVVTPEMNSKLLTPYHGFKNRTEKRTGKGSGSRIPGPTRGRTGDVINNLINNLIII